jgi:flavin reductase (DIM6/NTAB) family NADH-FMN oxidoreductase RutF
MENVSYTRYFPELMDKMTREGAFLTTKGRDGKINTMTIGWGSVGYYWNRPVFTCVVRQSRFTDTQLAENPVFTVSVPKDKALDKALAYCGTRSGRDQDKFAACGLTAQPGTAVDCPVVGEAWLHYECVIKGKTLLSSDALEDDILQACYKNGDMHVAYYGEIVACYVNE